MKLRNSSWSHICQTNLSESLQLTNPLGGPVGEQNEKCRYVSQRFMTTNSCKDLCRELDILTLHGNLSTNIVFNSPPRN